MLFFVVIMFSFRLHQSRDCLRGLSPKWRNVSSRHLSGALGYWRHRPSFVRGTAMYARFQGRLDLVLKDFTFFTTVCEICSGIFVMSTGQCCIWSFCWTERWNQSPWCCVCLLKVFCEAEKQKVLPYLTVSSIYQTLLIYFRRMV